MDNGNKMDKETQAIGLRYQALDLAIKSGSGNEYDNATLVTTVNSDKIVEAAKKFETFMNGGNNGN